MLISKRLYYFNQVHLNDTLRDELPRSVSDLQQVEIVGGFELFTLTIVGWFIMI